MIACLILFPPTVLVKTVDAAKRARLGIDAELSTVSSKCSTLRSVTCTQQYLVHSEALVAHTDKCHKHYKFAGVLFCSVRILNLPILFSHLIHAVQPIPTRWLQLIEH